MKVLFISRGKLDSKISIITLNQGESIKGIGVSVDYYTIEDVGFMAYLKAIFKLKAFLKRNKYDIIHAHYSLTAFVVSIAGAKPLVVSLMGSDVKAKSYYRFIIKFFNRFFWSAIIVKSEDMKKILGIDQTIVAPNGVYFEKFTPLSKQKALGVTGWDKNKRHVLFAADPKRQEKNYILAKEAYDSMGIPDVDIHVLENIPNELMASYYNAADVIILTSLWEGSPNVIKEAMACNRPIVSTDVGDVSWLFGDSEGHFISSYDVKNVAENIERALEYAKEKKATKGRQRIIDLELDSESIAKRIIGIYSKVLKD
ncbi:MAG TPA: glycosyl transferase group 1 [Bacteroidales bacterium]|nr:glycosyl transferase group 1 [Bacteroidales bacterium]